MRLSALLLSLAMVTFAGNALAHTRSETHSSWEVRGADVRLQVMAPDLEAARITQDGSAPSAAALGAYIAEKCREGKSWTILAKTLFASIRIIWSP